MDIKFNHKKSVSGGIFSLSHEFVRSSINRSLFIKYEEKVDDLFKPVI